MPSLVNSPGYPVRIRMDMVPTGVSTQIGVKVTDDNLAEIEAIARDIASVISETPGTCSACVVDLPRGYTLEFSAV
ncbi:MAG: hypothetical protein ACO33A_04910 [Hyphomonas sp.]